MRYLFLIVLAGCVAPEITEPIVESRIEPTIVAQESHPPLSGTVSLIGLPDARILPLLEADLPGWKILLEGNEGYLIYYGGYDPNNLGMSFGSYARIYSENFVLWDDEHRPQALANVTSHELGHLMGLKHVRDASDVMDGCTTQWRLGHDQWFKYQ